jgi:multicomponent Na+:H+ antiporter subunit G
MISELIVKALMLAGALSIAIAGIGILRLPDLFMRISAVTKSLTLGMGCLLLAVAIHFNDAAVSSRAFIVIVFFLLTSSVSAHMLGRAAYLARTPLWKKTFVDELRGKYNLGDDTLKSSEAGTETRDESKAEG